MKTGVICLCALACIAMILVAGCTSGTGSNGTAAGTTVPSSAAGAAGQVAVDQDRVISLTNGTYSFNASIDQIFATVLPSGSHEVDIFVRVTDTGTTPLQLQWYSTLTNAKGSSFGGIGVSHGGYGSETPPLGPGQPASGRDYVTIVTDQDYQALKNGATLTVNFFTEPLDNQAPVRFSATWTLDPADFT
jgi:hypothetical protein